MRCFRRSGDFAEIKCVDLVMLGPLVDRNRYRLPKHLVVYRPGELEARFSSERFIRRTCEE